MRSAIPIAFQRIIANSLWLGGAPSSLSRDELAAGQASGKGGGELS